MNEAERSRPPSAGRPRIVDVVFDVQGPEKRRRLWIAVLAALGAHVVLLVWAEKSQRTLESWSAEVAVRIHAELMRDEFVELEKPPPPKEEQPEPPKPEAPKPPPTKAALLAPKIKRAESTKPPPPAQAGQIVAQAPNPNAPVDLTGESFVTGTGDAYAGGVTSAKGTNTTAVPTREVDVNAKPHAVAEAPDLSSAVSLDDQSWSCPWPPEADAEQIDEETVVLKVVVRPNGRVESATVVKDPGHGFGPAAASCAMRTRFEPARDRIGRAIRSESPPIRVRFTR